MYKIDSNEWTELEPHPIKHSASTAVFSNGFVYDFGGISNSGIPTDIYRIKPKIGENWQFVDEWKNPSKINIVIPYNNKNIMA